MSSEELLLKLQQKEEEFQDLKSEFEEFQDMSKSIEAELESELERSTLKINQLEKQNSELTEELSKYKSNHISNTKELENINTKYKDEISTLQEKLKQAQRKLRHLETDLDFYKSKSREKDFEIDKLTEFYHKTLEDLAITCSELESLKDYNEENTYRLKEQLAELNNELHIAKRKSLKRIQSHKNEMKNVYGSLKSSMSGQSAQVMLDLMINSLNSQLK